MSVFAVLLAGCAGGTTAPDGGAWPASPGADDPEGVSDDGHVEEGEDEGESRGDDGDASTGADDDFERDGFRCDDGDCIELDRVCDEAFDCLDRSDEAPLASSVRRRVGSDLRRLSPRSSRPARTRRAAGVITLPARAVSSVTMGAKPRSEPGELPPTVQLGLRATDEGAGAEPARGQRIGRFVVLRTLGVGGMGVVVSAYDPDLDRTVALKLLRPDVAPGEGSTGARARLLREAQAMAKLRHPNAVAVFEVGEYEGQVFLAMEYVPGMTLSEWSAQRREEPRGWQRTVAAFVQAGRALVAAHARGLVHRDFKPANVLVEGDRVQVTDFGIASIDGRELVDAEALAAARAGASTGRTGTIVGTAPYMAPELFAGAPADPKTDQFAFCVALYESLFGQRPFAGERTSQWARSIEEGRALPPDDDRGVPAWIVRAVMRGLAKDPAERWPSMAALVDTLASPEDAELGRNVRVAIGVAIGTAFVALPFLAKGLGPPFDRSTHAGAVGQTLALIAILLAMAWASRDLVRATAINRKTFYGVLAVLGMQLPLELANAALGVSVVASDIQHLVLWAAMAAMFGIALDRRFLVLAASYLLCLPAAIALPEHHLVVLGISNAVLVAFVTVVWRPSRTGAEIRGL